MLMTLAFLIDQVLLLSCDLFKKVKIKHKRWYALFEKIWQMFVCVVWDSWEQFLELLLNPEAKPPPNWYGMPIVVKS